MEAIPFWLPIAFFAIALAYSSAGFGGGSSYLAILALIGLSYRAIPQTALVCNLVVAAGGVWHFRRGGYVDPRRVLPFLVLSIPMAYLGGRVEINARLFTILLAASLMIAAVRMFIPNQRFDAPRHLTTRQAWSVGLAIGAVLGFLAGMVGIGGGIFLAPVLLLSGWADAKQTAAAAAIFIFVNSAAGFAGQLAKGIYLDGMIFPLLIAVFFGGQIGSRIGAYRLPLGGVRRVIASLILLVSLRLIWSVV